MGAITSGDRIIHATLTDEGRRILFEENERFIISQFALGDGEINYNLVDREDPDYANLESLTVFEPSIKASKALESKLIRYIDNIEEIAKLTQHKFIPSSEVKIVTQVQGTQTFSLENWNHDSATISFAIHNPNNLSYYLSSDFRIDFSEFWSKYQVYFDFIPISPSGTIGVSSKYWFIADEDNLDDRRIPIPVVVGIDNAHKPVDGTSVENLVNHLSIPILTFRLRLPDRLVQKIYRYLIENDMTKLEGNVVIMNNDKDVKPVTDFYGPNKSYQNIQTSVPLTITF